MNDNDPAAIRAQIANVAKAKGLGLAKVGQDFSERFGGAAIGSADLGDLRAFLQLLTSGEVTA